MSQDGLRFEGLAHFTKMTNNPVSHAGQQKPPRLQGDWSSALKEIGSRLSAFSLIKLLLFNLLSILSVNNPTHMYLIDLRVHFKVEFSNLK